MRTNIEGLGRPSWAWADSPLANAGLSAIVPFVMIGLSELLVYSGQLELSLWGHLLTFMYCALGPLILADETHVFRALALVPLFRLVNLGVPVFFELTLLWLPLVYGPFLVGLFMLSSQDSLVTMSVDSFKQTLFVLPVATALALLLSVVEYRIIQPPPLIPSWDPASVLLLSVIMFGFVALVEELLFRGILQRTLVNRLGPIPGVAMAAVVFGLMHSVYGQPAEVGFATLIGLVVGVIYVRTSNLILITYIHGLLNIALFGAFPLLGAL